MPGILARSFTSYIDYNTTVKLFVDNLTTVDFSYIDPVRGILGESWQTSIEMHGQLNEQGMVCDFSHVKKYSKRWLDNTIDHTLVVPLQCNSLTVKHLPQDLLLVEWVDTQQRPFRCQGPVEAFSLIDVDVISTKHMAQWAAHHLSSQFPDAIEKINITFNPEEIEGAYYHYSHGLKKHDGNCQRIAHGHRSQIKIRKNNQRDTEAELDWAQRWKDIYIGSQEDLKKEMSVDNVPCHFYQYQANQGAFELLMPAACCYLFEGDTTVENLSQHIAKTLKQENPNDEFTVFAYEGIGKGAISQS